MSKLTTPPAGLQGVHREILHEQTPPNDELERLRGENAELRARLEEIDQAWLERQREFENLLEEKSDVIRGLHLKMQEQQAGGSDKRVLPQEQELVELQQQLEEERRQLQQDEEALMVQMRQMEMTMSRERAELARQRTELQRLQGELNREAEMASRDSGLRERLSALRRQDSSAGRSFGPGASESVPASNNTPVPKKGSSGLLRRIFGQ